MTSGIFFPMMNQYNILNSYLFLLIGFLSLPLLMLLVYYIYINKILSGFFLGKYVEVL